MHYVQKLKKNKNRDDSPVCKALEDVEMLYFLA